MPGSIHIAFGRHSVEVASEVSRILEWVREAFGGMVSEQPLDPLERLDVVRRGRRYAVRATDVPQTNGTLPATLHCLRYSVIQRFMDARSELVWFHGAAAAQAGRAILLPGVRGRGKSTLVAALCDRAWHYVSDDVLPVNTASLLVEPFPQTAAFREHPGDEKGEEWLLTARKRRLDIPPSQICAEPQHIAALVFPAYRPAVPVAIERRNPATTALALLEGCWGFPQHRERAVARVADLVGRVPAYDLTFTDGAAAAAMIEDSLLLA